MRFSTIFKQSLLLEKRSVSQQSKQIFSVRLDKTLLHFSVAFSNSNRSVCPQNSKVVFSGRLIKVFSLRRYCKQIELLRNCIAVRTLGY